MNSPYYVEALYRYAEKRGDASLEDQLICVEGRGIEGDWHADGSERQISLMGTVTREWMQAQSVQGLCFHRYNENISLGNADISELQPGDQLIFDEAVLEVAGHRKKCFPDICEFAAQKETCILAGTACFAYVKKSGRICREEKFQIKKGQ